MHTSNSTASKYSRHLKLVLIFLVSFAFLYDLQFQSAFLPEVDSYFHTKFAQLMNTEGLMRNFRWATQSVWNGKFSDKEFLFHLYLLPFTWLTDPVRGVKLAAVLLSSCTFTSIYLILKLNRVLYPALWWSFLFFSGHFFLWRIDVVRPQILSVLLLLWTVHSALYLNELTIHKQDVRNKGRARSRVAHTFKASYEFPRSSGESTQTSTLLTAQIPGLYKYALSLFALSVLYPWAYMAAFLPVVVTGIILFGTLIYSGKFIWRPFAIACLGFILGMNLHPYFPYNWNMLWMPTLGWPWLTMTHQLGLLEEMIPREFLPMPAAEAWSAHWPLFTSLIATLLGCIAARKPISLKVFNHFLITLAFGFLTVSSKRFTEYSVPLAVLLLGLLATHLAPQIELWVGSLGPSSNRLHLLLRALAVGTFLSFAGWGVSTYPSARTMFSAEYSRYFRPAKYLQENTEQGEIVFTCDWDQAPELFFFNHWNRYLIFLDPILMYFHDQEKFKVWYRIGNGQEPHAFEAIRDQFGARFGVCPNQFWALKMVIKSDPRIQIVFQDNFIYVFKLLGVEPSTL